MLRPPGERGWRKPKALLRLSAELSAPTFACFAERHRGEAYMYLGDAGAPTAFARARALAESIDDPFNLACTDMGLGHLEVSLGRDDQGYELLESGQFEVGGVRLWPHVREQPGRAGRGGTASR